MDATSTVSLKVRVSSSVVKSNVKLTKDGGVTPLMIASKKGHLRVVNALIYKGGMDLDVTMKGGSNAVHVAAESNHSLVLDALIAAGASAIGKEFLTRKIVK